MDFRNWILETFTPVVMVIPSREAESLVADRNGLTIVDLLRPYGYFHHLSGMSAHACLHAFVQRNNSHQQCFITACKAPARHAACCHSAGANSG